MSDSATPSPIALAARRGVRRLRLTGLGALIGRISQTPCATSLPGQTSLGSSRLPLGNTRRPLCSGELRRRPACILTCSLDGTLGYQTGRRRWFRIFVREECRIFHSSVQFYCLFSAGANGVGMWRSNGVRYFCAIEGRGVGDASFPFLDELARILPIFSSLCLSGEAAADATMCVHLL